MKTPRWNVHRIENTTRSFPAETPFLCGFVTLKRIKLVEWRAKKSDAEQLLSSLFERRVASDAMFRCLDIVVGLIHPLLHLHLSIHHAWSLPVYSAHSRLALQYCDQQSPLSNIHRSRTIQSGTRWRERRLRNDISQNRFSPRLSSPLLSTRPSSDLISSGNPWHSMSNEMVSNLRFLSSTSLFPLLRVRFLHRCEHPLSLSLVHCPWCGTFRHSIITVRGWTTVLDAGITIISFVFFSVC